MHLATALSILTLWVNLSTAVAQFAIARAPGWRSAGLFGFIALAAACYSLSNMVYTTDGLPTWTYLAAGRWSYLWASLHIVAWYPYAFGGPEGRWQEMPRPLRLVAGSALACAALFLVTGWHLRPEVTEIAVAWAQVTYHYALTTPLGDAYGVLFVLLLAVPFAHYVRRWRRGEDRLGLLVLGFTLFVLSGAVEVMVANRWLVTFSPAELGFLAVVAPTSLRSIRRFIEDARRLRELSGKLAGEVRERTEERDRAESALVESERLAALGRLAAGVGHEINNPLTYLQLALDRVDTHLAGAGAPAHVSESLAHARDGARRIEKVVEGLRTYSRRPQEDRPLSPAAVARAAMQVAHPHLRHVARVEAEYAPTPCVSGDEPRLVQALVNLLVNAAQAVAERGGEGSIRFAIAARAPGEVVFEVADDGPGIPADALAHLAEPYFTTRALRGGLGLGLFLTRGIVAAHGGRIEFESEPGTGTVARIVLPALSEPAAPLEPLAPFAPTAPREPLAPRPDPPPRPEADRGRHVLLVDDEPLVLSFLTNVLGRHWRVTAARDGHEALAWLERERFDAIVCDLMMPGLSGMELAERVAARDPALRTRMLFLTGGAVTPQAERFVARPDVTCVGKPIDVAALVAQIEERMGVGPA